MYSKMRGLEVDCGCFGVFSASTVNSLTIARTLILALVAGGLYYIDVVFVASNGLGSVSGNLERSFLAGLLLLSIGLAISIWRSMRDGVLKWVK